MFVGLSPRLLVISLHTGTAFFYSVYINFLCRTIISNGNLLPSIEFYRCIGIYIIYPNMVNFYFSIVEIYQYRFFTSGVYLMFPPVMKNTPSSTGTTFARGYILPPDYRPRTCPIKRISRFSSLIYNINIIRKAAKINTINV